MCFHFGFVNAMNIGWLYIVNVANLLEIIVTFLGFSFQNFDVTCKWLLFQRNLFYVFIECKGIGLEIYLFCFLVKFVFSQI